MIVSILQRMGFPMGKSANPPTGEKQQTDSSKARNGGITSKSLDVETKPKTVSASKEPAKANSARSQEVKTQPEKAKVASKAVKAAKAEATSKSTAKAVAPPAAKTKSAAKPSVQQVKQPAVQAASKAEPAGKIKPQNKATASVKPAANAQKVVKAVVVPVAKVQSKETVKASTEKPSKPTVAVSKSKEVPAAVPVKIIKADVPPQPVVTATAPAGAAPVPPRAGRPSSRLAQLTVPSMAQSVASTAAKASFTQTMSTPIIVPPLASTVKKDPQLANNWKLKPVDQLTDADLLSMPDEEYMNDTQMAVFRLKLTALKRDILSNAGETTEHLREETVVVPDPADRATIEEEHALELRTRDRERKLLKKIEQSIVRIDAGDYGYCDETGEPIGVGRLLARPTATLSLEAQQRRELKQKMFGD